MTSFVMYLQMCIRDRYQFLHFFLILLLESLIIGCKSETKERKHEVRKMDNEFKQLIYDLMNGSLDLENNAIEMCIRDRYNATRHIPL